MSISYRIMVVLSALAFVGVACRASEVDQSFIVSPSAFAFDANNQYSVAQTFTVGVNGVLSGVQLEVGREPDATDDLTVEILAGLPTNGTLLATHSFAPTDVPLFAFNAHGPSGMLSVDFSSNNIVIHPGEVMTIELQSAAPYGPPYQQDYAWVSTPQFVNGYDGGDAWQNPTGNGWRALTGSNAQDFGFQTLVVPLPAASSLGLIGFACVLFAGGRNRHLSRGD
jgi:hypothetical protein